MARGIIGKLLFGGLLGGALALGYFGVSPPAPKPPAKEKAPPIERVEELARYIKANIPGAKYVAHRDNKSPRLVYYLPDIHTTGFHRLHYEVLSSLHNAAGLDLVGVEGQGTGEITQKSLDEEVEAIHRFQGSRVMKNLMHPGSDLGLGITTISDLLGTVKTKKDLLDISPVLKFADENDGVTLYGLEDPKVTIQSYTFDALRDLFSRYYSIAHSVEMCEETIARADKSLENEKSPIGIDWDGDSGKRDLEKRNQELGKIKDEFAQKKKGAVNRTAEIRKRMDAIRQKYLQEYKLPDYDEGIKGSIWEGDCPFYVEVLECRRKLTLDRRSSDAVEILLGQMKEKNLGQGALVFGEGHECQIEKALDRFGVSHITIKHYSPKND